MIYRLSGPTTAAKPVIPPSAAAPRAAKPLAGEEGAEVLTDVPVGVRALERLQEPAQRAVVADDGRTKVLIPREHRIDCLFLLLASHRESFQGAPFAPLEVSAARLAGAMELPSREGYPRSEGRRRSDPPHSGASSGALARHRGDHVCSQARGERCCRDAAPIPGNDAAKIGAGQPGRGHDAQRHAEVARAQTNGVFDALDHAKVDRDVDGFGSGARRLEGFAGDGDDAGFDDIRCLLYTSPSPRD